MEYKDYVKVGQKVRYIHTSYSVWGSPIGTTEEIVTVKSHPRDKYSGRFVSFENRPYFTNVTVEFSCGEIDSVEIECLEPYFKIQDLTFEQLKTLRSEIHPGSLYLSDFRNSFGVDEKTVSDYADGYIESLYEEYGDDWEKYDTPENFAEYCE